MFADHNLVPVLNSLAEIEAWGRFCRERGTALATDIHADTGMSRLGLTGPDVALLAAQPELAKGISVSHVMSHLACAEEQDNPFNGQQLAAFREALTALAPVLSGKSLVRQLVWHLPGARLPLRHGARRGRVVRHHAGRGTVQPNGASG